MFQCIFLIQPQKLQALKDSFLSLITPLVSPQALFTLSCKSSKKPNALLNILYLPFQQWDTLTIITALCVLHYYGSNEVRKMYRERSSLKSGNCRPLWNKSYNECWQQPLQHTIQLSIGFICYSLWGTLFAQLMKDIVTKCLLSLPCFPIIFSYFIEPAPVLGWQE